jgi:TfoX/Sxy family transcriptional regulator of competence genes
MAYDDALAARIRDRIGAAPDLTEKKMFGGLAFLIGGNMAVAASREGGLLLRCEPSETQQLVNRGAARRMVMRGRELDGWLRVDAAAVEQEADLRRWVAHGAAYARSLPAK